MMELRVAKIASIEFRHEFFAEAGFNWQTNWPTTYPESLLPSVKPSTQTIKKLQSAGLRIKQSPRGFDIYTEVKNSGGKLLSVYGGSENLILYFNLYAASLSWPLFTRQFGAANGVALFSNLSGNKPSGSTDLYLHNEVIASAAGTKLPATVVRKANKVYEALERTNSQPPSTFWAEIGTSVDFTTLSNRVSVNQGFVKVVESDLKNANLEIKDVYGVVVFQRTMGATTTEKELSLDVSHLEEGVYSYHFNGLLRDTFFLARANQSTGFGLLEIAFQGLPNQIPVAERLTEEWLPIANGNGTLQAGEINPLTFLVHFLHPSAKWRYAFNRDLAIPNSDVPSDFEKLSNTLYQSKKAKALLRTSSGPDFGLKQKLPAPEPAVLSNQLNGSQELEAFISTTYVNV